MCKVRHHRKGLDKFEPLQRRAEAKTIEVRTFWNTPPFAEDRFPPIVCPPNTLKKNSCQSVKPFATMEMEGALHAKIGHQQIIRRFAFWNACITLPGGYLPGIKVKRN